MQSKFETQNRPGALNPKRTFALSAVLALSSAFAAPLAGHAQTTISAFEDNAIAQQDYPYRGTDQHIYFRY